MRALPLLVAALLIVGCEGRKPVVSPEQHANATIESAEELAAAADIPLYPGAQLPEGRSNIKTLDKETRYEIIMTTADDPAKVQMYYEREAKVSKIPDTGSLMGLSSKGHFLKLDIARKGDETTITAVAVKEMKP